MDAVDSRDLLGRREESRFDVGRGRIVDLLHQARDRLVALRYDLAQRRDFVHEFRVFDREPLFGRQRQRLALRNRPDRLVERAFRFWLEPELPVRQHLFAAHVVRLLDISALRPRDVGALFARHVHDDGFDGGSVDVERRRYVVRAHLPLDFEDVSLSPFELVVADFQIVPCRERRQVLNVPVGTGGRLY